MQLIFIGGQGILYGIVMAFMIGPVFFTLIRTSIEKDFNSGVLLAFGIALSEGIVIGVSYFCVSWLAENTTFYTMLGIAGGSLMVAFGISSFFRNSQPSQEAKPIKINKNVQGIRYVSVGFFLNVLNPPVYVFWMGISASILNYTSLEVVILFSGTIITIFLTDTLKAYVADKISSNITPRLLTKINKIVGTVLLGFGLRLLYFGMFGI